ncbi:MAG: molybdopterin-dependent oxidoreductase [Deltaproteobacteria bacterium]|nr:molybdopterin-dependent oxidoreductase [Deltaproteobacteria bacterium]
MAHRTLASDRAKIYKLLSFIYHDEVQPGFAAKMASPDFQQALECFLAESPLNDLNAGLLKMAEYFKGQDPAETHKALQYEYADSFLNAGANPVFPYESVYVSREPVVMGGPVFEVRTAYRKAGVHKSDAFKDLDDHIAVELEFLRHLLEQIAWDPDGAADKRKEHIAFLRDHLMGWGIEFCAVLSSSAVSSFYKGLAEFTMAFLFNERMLALGEQAGKEPDVALARCFEQLAALVDKLDLPEGYLTLSEGLKEAKKEKEIPTHCYICGALCGQTAKVKDNVIVSLKGLPGDPKGAGRLCPKGAAAVSQVYSAYRLKTPLIKENGRFRKASWDEALDLAAGRLADLDPSKVGYMRGNDWNNWLHEALFDYYGAVKTTHRPMCDNANRIANEHNLNDKRPWIHYGDSDYIILFGNNDLATSYGQRKTAMLRAALDRGAKLVVFDPRRSETAAAATEWVPLKPGTDGAVAMAMCYVIVTRRLYNEQFVENWTHGFEDFRRRLLGEEDGAARTPEWAEDVSGVPARTIERLAEELAVAENKGVMSWTGVAQTPNGMYGTQALQALNGLLGTFDAPGGPSLPFKRKLGSAWGEGQIKPPGNAPKEKLNKLGMWSGWAPAHFPADVAAGKIVAVVNYFGDPVLSWGNQEATAGAFESLDFSVSIDAFMGNTALLSQVVLPDATYLEQGQIKADWLYDACISCWQEVVPPLYDSRASWDIFMELAKRMNMAEYFPWADLEEAQRNQLKGTPWSLDELKEKGFIITDEHEFLKYEKWGGFNPPEGYGSSGKTKTGKYNFKNPVAEEKGLDPLPDYKPPDADLAPDEAYPLIFGNFRLFEHEHSSTFSNVQLMKLAGKNPLWINPVDAAQRDIHDGDSVTVRSPWGALVLPVRVTWHVCRGAVASAGGFGHKRGMEGDPKYPQFGGVNTPGCLIPPNVSEPMGGTSLLKYVKVQVQKAE